MVVRMLDVDIAQRLKKAILDFETEIDDGHVILITNGSTTSPIFDIKYDDGSIYRVIVSKVK